MPHPLSSHTSSSGIAHALVGGVRGGVERPLRCRVVERGIAEAARRRWRRPATGSARRAAPARPMAKATPIARGRCEAIVDVCGITARPAWPNTLWRPPAIGSSTDGEQPEEHVADAVVARAPGGPGRGRSRRSGSAAAPDRSAAVRRRPRRSPRDRPTRWCRSRAPGRAASGPCGRGGGCPAGRRTRRPAPSPSATSRAPAVLEAPATSTPAAPRSPASSARSSSSRSSARPSPHERSWNKRYSGADDPEREARS